MVQQRVTPDDLQQHGAVEGQRRRPHSVAEAALHRVEARAGSRGAARLPAIGSSGIDPIIYNIYICVRRIEIVGICIYTVYIFTTLTRKQVISGMCLHITYISICSLCTCLHLM